MAVAVQLGGRGMFSIVTMKKDKVLSSEGTASCCKGGCLEMLLSVKTGGGRKNLKTKSAREHSSLPCGGFGFPLYALWPHVTSIGDPHWLKLGFSGREYSWWVCASVKGGTGHYI